MNEKIFSRLINIAYAVAAILILGGAFFRIQHYPYGNELHNTGFVLGILTGITDNFILRKKIKKLEAINKKKKVSKL